MLDVIVEIVQTKEEKLQNEIERTFANYYIRI